MASYDFTSFDRISRVIVRAKDARGVHKFSTANLNTRAHNRKSRVAKGAIVRFQDDRSPEEGKEIDKDIKI